MVRSIGEGSSLQYVCNVLTDKIPNSEVKISPVFQNNCKKKIKGKISRRGKLLSLKFKKFHYFHQIIILGLVKSLF